ncbi:MAG TPA: D-alanyl-D-alanine carboxypeptidase/D-alanyl-D-alanine-endopeptidase [Aquabacterium sp.]|nr:D-alanyl-D-alanine carboxypeptidase/D-alanyl-D-alanine-endopeptidase [Aquabacterium sp.]
MYRCLCLLWVLVLAAWPVQAAPDGMWAALQRAGISPDKISLMAQPVDGGAPLLAHNEARSFTLASTTKLVTSLAALDQLGPRFRWQTRAYLLGPLHQGVLEGDLLIVGGGNARLSAEDLRGWFRQMQQKGLHTIRGHIILNRGAFQTRSSDHAGTPVPNSANPHHAWPEAFVLDEGVITIDAKVVGAGLDLQMSPRLDGVTFLNLSKVKKVKCSALKQPITVSFEELYQPPRILVQGDWAPGCSPSRFTIATLPGSRFAPMAVAAAWRDAGGVLDGLVMQPESAYAMAHLARSHKPFAVHESARLGSLLRDMNKWSNNLMARHLMLSMSRGFPARPATLTEARQRMAQWLTKQGLGRADLSLDNGSGLSHDERGKAQALVQLLRKAWSGPHAQALMQSLPVAGQDGTLSNRLTQSSARGKAFLKTGTLVDTRSLAGYVQGRSGRMYAVAAIINDPKATKGVPALDAFIEWIVDNG